jgi:nicotinic acid phosphoribosyltransferase
MDFGVMVLGIIQNHMHCFSSVAANASKVAHEKKETFGIEFLGTMEHELAIPQSYGSEVADASAGWVVVNHGVFHFLGNPHAAP